MGVLQDICAKITGPCVVVAGAGTGKTYTIVEKIVHMVREKHYTPQEIIAITFSNEAAANLGSRVTAALGQTGVTIRTFHALGADLLRAHGEIIGVPSDFRILTPDDAKLLLHKSLRVVPGLCHQYVHSFSLARDKGITSIQIDGYLQNALGGQTIDALTAVHTEASFMLQTLPPGSDKTVKRGLQETIERARTLLSLHKFLLCWKAYDKLKKKHHALDYADLQDSFLALLLVKPACAMWQYVIVDEFQDTNAVQLALLQKLALHRNIMVVGDPNQSIYRFRGAHGDVLHQFIALFGVGTDATFTLDASFRSPNTVLRAAHRVIQRNYAKPADCFLVTHATQREGAPVEVYECSSGVGEARKVVSLVQEEVGKGRKPEDICLITRTHQQSMLFRRAFDEAGIAFMTATAGNLLQHPVVKTVIDYLTVAHLIQTKKEGGVQSWWDLLYQLGFPRDDLLVLARLLKEKTKPTFVSHEVFALLSGLSLSEQGKRLLASLHERIVALLPLLTQPLSELLPLVYTQTGIVPSEEGKRRAEIVAVLARFQQEALSYMGVYGPDLGSFLHHIELLHVLGIVLPGPSLRSTGVQIMTGHATKGLEYPVVILASLAGKRFPLERLTHTPLLPETLFPECAPYLTLPSAEQTEAIERYEREQLVRDERRLFYVACTRTKERLILTYATSYAEKPAVPSVFLEELDYKTHTEVRFVHDAVVGMPFATPSTPLTFASLAFESVSLAVSVVPEQLVFSPSSLLQFTTCQKAYEYKYVLHMPDRKPVSWEAMQLGSFVHLVIEDGVRANYPSFALFEERALHLHLDPTWNMVQLDQALAMIAVFYERNKDKYAPSSHLEQELVATLGDFQFKGYADRIDMRAEGLEIIDYKTGKTPVSPRHRNWQLGYYVLAAEQQGLGKVTTVTLDMLQQEKPLTFRIDEKGIARAVQGTMQFSVSEVAQELIMTAQAVMDAYKTGFQTCPLEKGCEFCNEYMYGV